MTNICIIHYNTPSVTECLIRSINKFTPDSKIYLLDNSDKHPFIYRTPNLIYLDNTKGKIIDFNKWLEKFPERKYSSEATKTCGSAKHCYSVEKCMDIINDNFILLDSDVLLLKDISGLCDTKYLCAGQVIPQWNKKMRIAPFICFLNVKKMREQNIHYFSNEHMHGLFNSKNRDKDGYDTGCWLYECAKNNMKPIKMDEYIIHYGGGSWEDAHNSRHILMNNIGSRPKTISAENWAKQHMQLWNDEKIIVTMTTWKERISNVPFVLSTILKQTKIPNKIVINLSKEEFGSYDALPTDFKSFVSKNSLIEINWIEGKNTKQWKKTIPTMLKYPNDCVICIDDDRKYPDNFISALWNTHLKHPNNPITHNKGYKFKGKYLQHAGHGTLDKLEFYDGFKNIDFEPLYNYASSDTFFTLIAYNSGHPILPVEGNVKIDMFNEVFPLKKSQNTCNVSSHVQMYDYLTMNSIISLGSIVPKSASVSTHRHIHISSSIESYGDSEIKSMLNIMSDRMGVEEIKRPKAKPTSPSSRKREPSSLVRKFLY